MTRNRNAIPHQNISRGTAQNFYQSAFVSDKRKLAKSQTPRQEKHTAEGETEYKKTFQHPGWNQKVFQTFQQQ